MILNHLHGSAGQAQALGRKNRFQESGTGAGQFAYYQVLANLIF